MQIKLNQIHCGDAAEVLRRLPADSVDCIVTSPPYYGLRNYGVDGQIGLETSPEQFIARLLDVFRECRRVLRATGTMWVVVGDSYAGSGRGKGDRNRKGNKVQHHAGFVGDLFDKPYRVEGCKNKDLIGIPWMLAFALRADGWYLRQDVIWHKPNPMPESIRDRCTKAHEYVFLFSKSPRYYFNRAAMQEPAQYDGRKKLVRAASRKYSQSIVSSQPVQTIHHGGNRYNVNAGFVRNKRSVWSVPTHPFKGAHFATFPPDLITPCVLAGCPEGGIVLAPFMGAGTTAIVARSLGRSYVGVELNPDYIRIAEERLRSTQPN
jgi:DNA modification methylase